MFDQLTFGQMTRCPKYILVIVFSSEGMSENFVVPAAGKQGVRLGVPGQAPDEVVMTLVTVPEKLEPLSLNCAAIAKWFIKWLKLII